jgi:hypothetical protein
LMLTYKEEICSKEGVESEEVQHPERWQSSYLLCGLF